MSSVPLGESVLEPSKPETRKKGLPEGWRREVVVRKNGQSAGKTDVYYYSPCGKKFRSKPQIVRFLGANADLSVFDFSRAGPYGDGSSRRGARERASRRAGEAGRIAIPFIKPLSINPLSASGPTRRTCGVIKLPVTWVPLPRKEEEEMMVEVIKQEAEATKALDSRNMLQSNSSDSNVEMPLPSSENDTTSKPQEFKTTPPPPQALATLSPPAMTNGKQITPPPVPSSTSSSSSSSTSSSSVKPSSSSSSSIYEVHPYLWENRLRGVVVHDHETMREIRVDLEHAQNAKPAPHPPNGSASGAEVAVSDKMLSSGAVKALSEGVGADPKTTGMSTAKLNNLFNEHRSPGTIGTIPPPIAASIGSVVPSLLAHGTHRLQQTQKVVGGRGGGASIMLPGSVKPTSRSFGRGTVMVPSGRASHVIKHQHHHKINTAPSGDNIVLTLPTIAAQGAIKIIKASGTDTGSSSSSMDIKRQMTRPANSSSPAIPAGKTYGSGSPLAASGTETSQSLFVSESELVRQEERVRHLREKLLAAQGAK